MENETNIQWFPGHMARARRILSENLSLVDVVVELVDARIPYSSRNPEIDKLLGEKKRVIAANKCDLADVEISAFWKNYYAKKNIDISFIDCKSGYGVRDVTKAIENVMAEKIARKMERGMRSYTIKTMVVGIPNVGKSSFINKVAGRKVAVTGDKPGVTRNKQWLRMNDKIALLDTPGLLWPKFDNQNSAFRLACTGAIKDDILDRADIACFLLLFVYDHYKGALQERYGVDEEAINRHVRELDYEMMSVAEMTPECIRRNTLGRAILEACAVKRGFLQRGGVIDEDRICAVVLDDYRAGKFGRISMDIPQEILHEESSDKSCEDAGKQASEAETVK